MRSIPSGLCASDVSVSFGTSMSVSVAALTHALVCRQLAYVQGVSNWNFDVAELKARAALEDPLPTVPERAPPRLSCATQCRYLPKKCYLESDLN